MNGFFAPGRGIIALDSRADVMSADVQRILCEHHVGGGVTCTCRIREATVLSLEVIAQPDGKFRLDRRSVSDPHADECIFRLEDDFELHPPSPSMVFDLSGRSEGSARAFRHLARYFLSAVHSDRFISSLRAGRETTDQILPEIFSALARKIGSRSGYPSYSMWHEAAGRGLTLSWGLLRGASEVVPRDARVPLLLDTWSCALGGMESRIRTVTDQAWSSALGPLRVLDRVVTGPYLFLAATNTEGAVVKLSLHPIYLDGVHVLPVDSHTERRRAAQLVASGISPYHPLRLDDFRRVCRAIAAKTGRSIAAPSYRPDFIHFNGHELTFEEIRGFRPGRLPTYDEHFEHKQTVGAVAGVISRWLEGWNLPEPEAPRKPFHPRHHVVVAAIQSLTLLDLPALE